MAVLADLERKKFLRHDIYLGKLLNNPCLLNQ